MGFGLAACKNLLSGRPLQLQSECPLLPQSIRRRGRREAGTWPSSSQRPGPEGSLDAGSTEAGAAASLFPVIVNSEKG